MLLKLGTILALCTQPVPDEFPSQLHEAAETYEVEPELLLAVVATESRCNNKVESSEGAIGYGQIIPRWWNDQADELEYNIEDPNENLLMTAYIVDQLTSRHSLREALRRYYGYRRDKPGSWEAADAYASRVLTKKQHASSLEEEMEWEHQVVRQPNPGDQRVVERFLWFPMRLENRTVWLERRLIVEEYKKTPLFKPEGPELYTYKWVPVMWGYDATALR